MRLNGAQIVWECLVREGVDTLFGITGGTVITMDPERRVLEDGAVAIVGDRIQAVGASRDIQAAFRGKRVIDARRKVRTVRGLDMRICGTMSHLEDPENKVYMLGMEGEFIEADVTTLVTTQLFNLLKELAVGKSQGCPILVSAANARSHRIILGAAASFCQHLG